MNQMILLNHQTGTLESNKKVLSMVKRALDYAIDQGLIQNNPAASSLLNVTGKYSTRTEPYTVEEMQYTSIFLLAAVKN